jgi:hypothetical protein
MAREQRSITALRLPRRKKIVVLMTTVVLKFDLAAIRHTTESLKA